MKNSITRLLVLVLAILMLGATFMTACAPDNGDTPNDSEDNATDAPEPEAPVVLTEQTVALNKNTKGIKVLGVRHLASDTTINVDWSASGIEFVATCEGDMTFAANSTAACYFRAYVDGEPWNNGSVPYFTVNGKTNIVLKDIPKGTHTIKLLKVTGYTIALADVSSVTLTGYISEEAPADKKLYLEFIGDSLTCAWGTIGDFKGAYTDQDATLAYSYLLAEALDADYAMTALSGKGILYGNMLIPDYYRYASKSKDAKNEYEFDRKADIIVVNIGTNDETHNMDKDQFKAEFKKWIQFAKEINGEDCKFLAIWNMKNTNYYIHIQKVFEELGGEEAGYYIYKAKRSTNSGSYYHPNVAEHAAYVPDLKELCEKILATPITNTPATDAPTTDAPVSNAVALPANTVVVGETFFDAKNGQEVTFTFGGIAYKATVGKDAFAMFMDAIKVVPADGTMFLLPGTYTEDFKIDKNLTILGPKAGIDPNVKGAAQIDDWTLNPERGTDEAILIANIGPGTYNAEVFPDCHKVVIDGVQLSGGFLFRYNSGAEGNSRLELKNILIKDVTTTNQMFFFYPYYPKNMTSSSYVRDVLIENVRIEGLISKSLFRICAENLEVKGMYVDAASTQAMIGEHTDILGVTGTEGTDKWTFKDCMFKNTSTTIFRFDLTASAGTQAHLTNLGANKKLEVEINNCVFAGDHLTGEHPAWIAIKRDNQAVTLRVKDNVFISNGSNSPIITDEGSATGAYAAITEISGNIVTGTTGAYKFTAATDAAAFVK